MNELKNGWFIQQDRTRPGISYSLKVKEILAETGNVAVFRTEACGLVMTSSDGMIRYAADDFAAREMTVHCAAYSHEEPVRALVLDGSDGGLAGELLHHRSVEQIDICEQEEDAADLAAHYLPDAHGILHNSRVELFEDKHDLFLREHAETYDLIYATCANAPSKVFGTLKSLKAALRFNGVLTVRCATFFRAPERAQAVIQGMQKLFFNTAFAVCPSPVHPGGAVMFCIGSNTFDGARPVRHPMRLLAHRFKYYSTAYHKAIFQQPVFPGMKNFSWNEDSDDPDDSEERFV